MARPDKYALVLGFLLMLIVTGCAQGEGLAFRSPFSPNRGKVEDSEIEDVFAAEDAEATDLAAQTASVDAETVKEAFKELQELSRSDPELAAEFAAQVENTDPALLGELVRTWKAILAYKRQQQEQEEQLAWNNEPFGEEASDTIGDDFGPPLTELTPGVRDDEGEFNVFAEDAPFEDDLGFEETPVTDLRPFDRTAARPEQPVNYETFGDPQDMQGANQAVDLAAHSDSTFSDDFDPFEGETDATAAWDDPPQTAVDGAGSQSGLQRLIAEVEQQSGPLAKLPEGVDREVYLRLLYLMAGNREQAMQPIAGFSSDEQQFWTNMLWAMSSQLDRESIPNDSDRAAQTVQQLSEAAAQLRARATLEVKNLAFCQRIQSFGSYDRFKNYEFAATEPVLLYAEVNNFSSESTAEGYRTVLRSTIEILDLQGHQVWKQQFAPTEDLCESYRRDYFHSYNFSMPDHIYAGPYILKLTIEDQLAGKVTEGSIEFEVVDK